MAATDRVSDALIDRAASQSAAGRLIVETIPNGGSASPSNVRIQDGNGTAVADVLAALNDAMANGNGFLEVLAANGLYNDGAAVWERQRNNTQGTLLASATRTSSTISATQTNYNARGVILFLNVTAASGTGGLQTTLFYVDPISISGSGTVSALPTAVTTVTERTYVFYPTTFSGTGSAIAQTTGIPVPRAWYASVTHGDASNYTYSLGYAYIL